MMWNDARSGLARYKEAIVITCLMCTLIAPSEAHSFYNTVDFEGVIERGFAQQWGGSASFADIQSAQNSASATLTGAVVRSEDEGAHGDKARLAQDDGQLLADSASSASSDEVYGPTQDEVAVEFPIGVPKELAIGVASALDAYPSIRAARYQEDAAEQEVRAAKGQRFPSLTIDGQGLAGGSEIVQNQALALNVTVQQPIWSGGRIGASINRARAAREVAAATAAETGESIAIQTINAYFEAVLAKRRMEQLEQGNSQLNELVESISRRVDQSVSPRTDLTLVKSRQSEIQRQYQVAQATFFSSRELYRQLTGLLNSTLEEVPSYPGEAAHPEFDSASDETSACNPSVLRLNREAALAAADLEVAKKELYPTVSAQLSRNEITGTRFGVVVRSQLTNGLSQFRRVDASKARQLESTSNVQTAIREARVRLTQDVVLNYSTREQIPIVRTAVEAATELTQSYRRQFVAGRRSWLDVLNAVREEITADLNLVDAETSAMASGARILIYTCRWTPAIGS